MKKCIWSSKGKKNRIRKRKRESDLLQACSTKSCKSARNEECITEDGKEKRNSFELAENCMTSYRKQDSELLLPCSKLAVDGEGITAEADEEEKIKSLEMAEDGMACQKVEIEMEYETFNLCGIPLPPLHENKKSQVTFVLENASLALGYVGKRYQILNPDEHADFLRKRNKNPYSYRPDIVHRTLLGIMDSPLRMAGRLRAVYIKTDEGHLIKVEPNAEIPISLQSFCNMMAQLLQKLHIKAKGGRGKLLRLVDSPVIKHLPVNSPRIGFSFSSEKKTPLRDYLSLSNIDQELVFVVGVMAHGKIECDYVDDLISICGYHLSAATCVKTICTALQRKWSIR